MSRTNHSGKTSTALPAPFANLAADASRIFIASGSWDVRIVTFSPAKEGSTSGNGYSVKSISDMHSLEKALKVPLEQHSTRIFIIRQKNSWSRIQIPHLGFVQIISNFGVSSNFADFVHEFGYKSSSAGENFCSHHRQVLKFQEPHRHGIEMCYNIRYPERTNRDFEYPWGLRHMAVCQVYSPEELSSQWILLQPSRLIESRLEPILQNTESSDVLSALNVMILASTEANWRLYVNHLESEIISFNEKACYSKVGTAKRYDYSVTFNDSQELQLSRDRIFRAIAAVESSSDSCTGLEALMNDLHCTKDGGFAEMTTSLELKNIQARLTCHNRSLKRLLETSAGTSNLLLKIMDFRNDEAVRESAKNTEETLRMVGRENEVIRIMAQKTNGDSRSMRILTAVNIAYLPANLVAAIFSSNVVQTGDGTTEHSGSLIGYYVLTTIALSLFTLGMAMTMERGLLKHVWLSLRRSLGY
ncbi:hypothetical protein GQ53DRAFT_831382 [Thozetella sp. PMI_491]|nr:hypothetical protein GQ53DRAFT_831382 [Thozetella sp. PMI_491]